MCVKVIKCVNYMSSSSLHSLKTIWLSMVANQSNLVPTFMCDIFVYTSTHFHCASAKLSVKTTHCNQGHTRKLKVYFLTLKQKTSQNQKFICLLQVATQRTMILSLSDLGINRTLNMLYLEHCGIPFADCPSSLPTVTEVCIEHRHCGSVNNIQGIDDKMMHCICNMWRTFTTSCTQTCMKRRRGWLRESPGCLGNRE